MIRGNRKRRDDFKTLLSAWTRSLSSFHHQDQAPQQGQYLYKEKERLLILGILTFSTAAAIDSISLSIPIYLSLKQSTTIVSSENFSVYIVRHKYIGILKFIVLRQQKGK